MYYITAGVEYLHSMGILHRCLKPSNIAMTTEGPDGLPRIIYLGLAGFIEEEYLTLNAALSTIWPLKKYIW
jgi:serine/threonine protein kinase